jgi:dihydrofolate synthase/folylpolyglutamate synthase
MEIIPGQPSILLDGAKGPAAAAALAEALHTLYTGRRVFLMLGLLQHKDIEAMTVQLCPQAEAVIVAEPPWANHAARSEQVAEAARRYCAHVEQAPDVAAALARARTLAAADDLVVVAGSLILVGAVRDILLPTHGL